MVRLGCQWLKFRLLVHLISRQSSGTWILLAKPRRILCTPSHGQVSDVEFEGAQAGSSFNLVLRRLLRGWRELGAMLDY